MPSKRRQPVPAWVAQETAQADLQEISELDKIRRVEAFWKTQSRQQQSELLTFPVKDAKANAVKFDREAELRAKQKFEEEQWAIQGRKHHGELCKPGCSGKDCGWVLHPRKVARPTQEQLATGLKRLATAKSWNKWQWGPKHPAFHDAMAFRKHLETEHIDKELQPLLPKATGTSLEQKAVKDLSQRMGTMEKALAPALKALLQSVEDLEDARKHVCVFDPPSPSHQLEHKRIRNAFQGMIWYFFSELRQEDESLYSSLEEPVASHIWGMLKEWPGGGTSTKLCFDDLPKLPAEQVYKIADWLSDKVGLIASGHAHILLQSDLALKDSYSSDDDSIDDISLFVLTEDQRHLTVNQEWLAHLEKHMVCECGQVHLVGSGQTCGGIGAVLTWAYGRHQLKYEYGRYIANKPLDKAPTVEETFERLHKGLKRRQDMLEKLKVAKDMKRRLQISKRKLAALAATDNLRLTEADKEVLKHTDWNVFLEECQACCVPHDHECTEDKPCSNCQSSDSSGLQPSSANAGDKKANNTTTTSTSSSSNSTGSSQDGVKALRDSTMLALLRRELQLYLTNALLFILSNEQLVSRMKDSAALQQQNQAVLKCSRDTLRLIPEALVRRKAALSAGQRKKNTAEVAAKLHQHFPQYSMPVLVQWCEAINLSPGMAERVQGLKKAMADDKQTLAEQVTMYKHSISQGKVIEALLDELNHLVTCTRAIEAGTMKDKPSVEVPYPVAADEGSAQQPCPEPGSEPPSHHYSQRVLNQDSSNETGNDSASSGVGQQDSPDSAKQDAEAPTRLSDCEADLYAWQRLGPIALWPFPTSCISYDHKVYCPVKERTSSEGLSSQQPCEEQSHGCDSQDPCDAGSKTTAALGAAAASDSDSPSQEWCVLLREAYFPVWLLLQSGRSHFCKDIWADLSDMGREDLLLDALQKHIKLLEERLANNRAALIQLEALVIDVACDDPARMVGTAVLLPMLRERLESKAWEYHNRDILQAQQRAVEQKALLADQALRELMAEEEQKKAQSAQAATQSKPVRSEAKQHTTSPPPQTPQAPAQEAEQAKAEAKRAKKLRQKAKKQQAQQLRTEQSVSEQPSDTAQQLVGQQQQQQQRSHETGQVNIAAKRPGKQHPQQQLPAKQSASQRASDSAQQLAGPHEPQQQQQQHCEAGQTNAEAKQAKKWPTQEQSPSELSNSMQPLHRDHQLRQQQSEQLSGCELQSEQPQRTAQQQNAKEPTQEEPVQKPLESRQSSADSVRQNGIHPESAHQAAMQAETGSGDSATPAKHGQHESNNHADVESDARQQQGSNAATFADSKALVNTKAAAVAPYTPDQAQQNHRTHQIAQQQQLQHDDKLQEEGMNPKQRAVAHSQSPLVTKPPTISRDTVSTPYKASQEHLQLLFICPLTKAVMKEPVIAADGRTYEKQALSAWLQQHNTSPVTGKALEHVLLVPNNVIKSLIQQQQQQM